MASDISVFVIIYAAMGIITLLLALYSWARRSVPGTFWFALLMLAAAEWCLTFSLELFVSDPSLKVFIGKFQYLGIVSIAPLMLLFVAGYTRNETWLKGWKALVLWIVPAVTILLVFTNDMHGLVWPEIVPAVTGGTFVMVYANGPAAIASSIYSYVLATAAVSMLIFTLVQCSQVYRRQVWLLLACTGIFLFADLLDVLGLSPIPGLDLDPLALGIGGLIVFEGTIRFRLLDLAPVVYNNLFSTMHVGIIAVDTTGRVIECNPAARNALSLPETVGNYSLGDAAPSLAYLLPFADTDPGRQHEFSVGEYPDKRWFGARVSLLRDYSSQPYGKLVIFSDITASRKAQEDLQEAHNKLSILSSVTRHDILNNLTAMDMYLDLCRKRVADSSALGYIDRLEETSATIRNHIEFMRIYEETGGKEPAWFDLRTTVVEAAAAHSFRNVRIELGQNEIGVFADPLIGKVFYNLIDNSVTHGDHVTRCTVSAAENEEGLVITFEDDGCGIPAEDKEKVFTQGFGSHTGLGLFLISRILSITGISIRETGTRGIGARFEMVVPGEKYRIRPENPRNAG